MGGCCRALLAGTLLESFGLFLLHTLVQALLTRSRLLFDSKSFLQCHISGVFLSLLYLGFRHFNWCTLLGSLRILHGILDRLPPLLLTFILHATNGKPLQLFLGLDVCQTLQHLVKVGVPNIEDFHLLQ